MCWSLLVASHTQTIPPLNRHPGSKRIEKICLKTHQVLGTFYSITEASRSVGGRASSISKVLTGKILSCQGFFWRCGGSDEIPSPNAGKLGAIARQIERRNLKGEVLETYASAIEAAVLLGLTSPRPIYDAANDSRC